MKRIALAVFALALIFTACSPTEYSVTREVSIDAPVSVVFEMVNNHKNRDSWSPWERMDPNMTKTYEGPESGVGALYKWSGNDSVGTGSLEIMEVTENEMIKSKLSFTEPWESTSDVIWTFKEDNGATLASWTVAGELPGFMFWMGQEEMDANMGPDFERGLGMLKEVAESSKSNMNLNAEMVEVESMPYYYIRKELSFNEMDEQYFADSYGALASHLGDDMQNMNGPAFAIYHKWDEENQMTDMEVAMSCNSDKEGLGMIQKGMTYEGKAMKCTFKGPYEQTGEVHEFLISEIEKSGMEFGGSCWEVYLVGVGDTQDPNEYVTEVYYPVKAAS